MLLYGSENWPITQRLERCIVSCDRCMPRCIAGVSLRDRTTSEEVAERCCLAQISNAMRARRLKWYGHGQRGDEGEALAVVRQSPKRNSKEIVVAHSEGTQEGPGH